MNSNFSLLFNCVLDCNCNCFQDFHKRHRETVQHIVMNSGKILVQTDPVLLRHYPLLLVAEAVSLVVCFAYETLHYSFCIGSVFRE